jgi:hypothetical protein
VPSPPILPIRAWLALAVALLPAIAAHLAYALSIRDGYVPACLPYWDGCTSISRAARHGEGNHLFKTVMIPCALLSGWMWWEARRWLRLVGERPGPWLVLLGTLAAIALAMYVAFLGLEGVGSRALRRHGALLYFASTFLAQLEFLRYQWRRRARDRATWVLLVASSMLLLGGLASTAASGLVQEPELKDRIENAIEWCLGALFTAWFLALALLWRGEPQLPPAKKRAPPSPRSG